MTFSQNFLGKFVIAGNFLESKDSGFVGNFQEPMADIEAYFHGDFGFLRRLLPS